MKIREGAIDALLYLYKKLTPELNGYLTENGKISLERTEFLLEKLSRIENAFFQKQLELKRNNTRYQQDRPKVKDEAYKHFKEIKNIEVLKKDEELAVFEDVFADIEEIMNRKVDGNGEPVRQVDKRIILY